MDGFYFIAVGRRTRKEVEMVRSETTIKCAATLYREMEIRMKWFQPVCALAAGVALRGLMNVHHTFKMYDRIGTNL